MLEVRDIPIERRRRKWRSEWWIVGGVLVALGGLLVYSARDVVNAPANGPERSDKPQAVIERETKVESPVAEELVDDDGETLWVSPTDGPPLDLAYMPPGVEIILALRPAKLFSHPEGEKVLAALGPLGKEAIAFALHKVSYIRELRRAERFTVGLRFISDVKWDVTVTAFRPFEESEIPDAESEIGKDGGIVAGRQALSSFTSNNGRTLVGASVSTTSEISRLKGIAPPISRGLQRLLPHTDSERDVTILFEPALLFSDSRNVFSDEFAALSRAASDFIGQDVAAAALSLDWGDNFFIEFRAVPTLDSSPERLSQRLAERIRDWPEQVEESVVALAASPYGRRVVARLPEMVRRLVAYARIGYDEDCAIVRCYLPITAGHNLLMASELALAEGQGRSTTDIATRATITPTSQSIADRLKKRTSLRFDREELEAALDMLAEDVGTPITIRGRDLQLDGITRNQLFAIDLADRPAEEILVEILCRANPDKSATGPADPRQKLVYVVDSGGIIITTRAQAAARGEVLPAVFRPR